MKNHSLSALLAVALLSSTSSLAEAATAVVELQTNLGTIAVQLDYDNAPISSANFVAYVNSGFYVNTLIHRVVKDFVIQGGGFGRADGKAKTTLPPITNEANNGLSNLVGTIAMARTTDPNSATSQFFINLVDNLSLDYGGVTRPGYAVFGSVVSGLPIVQKIGGLPTMAPSSSVPFTSNSSLVWIDAIHTNETWDDGVSRTRISISGSGRVTSEPIGIDCGTTCSISLPVGDTIRITAKPALGFGFAGWRGDCLGERLSMTLRTTNGNHNCTAQFNRIGPATQ